MTEFRSAIAARFHANAQVPRSAIFGHDDPLPLNLPEDAHTMFAGFVGTGYAPGGTVLVAINPGGGGDAYTHRRPADEQLYPVLAAFRDAVGAAVPEKFEEINRVFPPLFATWPIRRIVGPCLEAAGARLDDIAYLNVVPYRTREDRAPKVSALRAAWREVTGPTLEVLRPTRVIALGKKAGDALQRFPLPSGTLHVVPRTIGDTYVSDAAQMVLREIERDGGVRVPAC